VGYFCYSENLNSGAQNLRRGRMRPVGPGLDIAVLDSTTTAYICTDVR